ncbi:MAG: transporter substrate-binding domain-containing protein [Chlorobi bacterium]|nr:transporter substrate-binding domain-containing protein [Chlorobiota bacterium]
MIIKSFFRNHFSFILITLAIFCSSHPRTWSRNLDDIKKSGKIYIAFEHADVNTINYPLAYEFARYLNLEVEEVIIDWDEAFSQNGTVPEDIETNPNYHYTPDALKKADIVCSTFSILEWRKKLFDFAETLKSAELLVLRSDKPMPGDLDALSGLKIALMDGTSFVTHLASINDKIGGGIKMIKTATTDESKNMVLDGKADGVILDADEALTFRKEHPGKVTIVFPISKITNSAWAVEKGNPLKNEVENFFRTISNNGILDKIFYEKFAERYSVFVESINPHTPIQPYHRDLNEILKSKKIIVGLRDRDFVYHKGENKQFMHALAEEFADYLGVEMEFVLIPEFGKYWEDSQGEIVKDSAYTPEIFHYFDIACDMISPLPWREKKVNLVPVYSTDYSVLARPETNIRNISDLKKYKGVTGRGTIYEEILFKNGIDSFYFAPVKNFISDVADGKADYTLLDNAFLYPQLEPKIALGSQDVCWALRKDQPQLLAEAQQFLSESKTKGLLNVLNRAQRGNTFLNPQDFLQSYYERFQTGNVPYILFSVENGLPQEDVTAILQDQKGYMWFGTNSGVVRYNGRKMEIFDVSKGLSDNAISDIKQDAGGLIYIATSKGVSVIFEDSVISRMLQNRAFNHIYIANDQSKWFLSNAGIFIVDSIGNFRKAQDVFSGLPVNINDMAEDTSGTVRFFASHDGLYILRNNEKAIRVLKDYCYSVFVDQTNRVWLSTPEGLFSQPINNIERGIKGSSLNKQFDIPLTIIKRISQSRSGSIWFMNDAHLYQLVSMDQKAVVYATGGELINNTLLSYCEDNEGNLWIGFSGGLQRIINTKNLRNFFPDQINNYIYSISQDKEGRIWIGTNDGVYYYQDDLIPFTSHLPASAGKTITALLPDGNILLATPEGLFEINRINLHVVKQNKSQLLVGLENVYVADDGKIFILTGKKGLIYYFPDFSSRPEIIQGRETASVYQLSSFNGRIIGGSNLGLIEFDGKGFKPFLPMNATVWSLCENEGALWIGTEKGLEIYRDNILSPVPLRDNHVIIKSIIPAKNRNYLWIGTNIGFMYFNKETNKEEFLINSKEGLSGDEVTNGGLFLDANGLLWIGTYHGISNFNIKVKRENEYSPRCYLERVLVNGNEIDKKPARRFRFNENNFVFEVSGLFYSDERSIEYEFYLRGQKRNFDMIRRGKEYRAYYTNLDPGKYTFVYRAKGKDNIWSYTGSFPFEIRKPFWETWWFRLLVVITVVLIIYALYKWRVSAIERQKEILEEQVRERTRELEQANVEIQAQRDLARGQRDMIAEQKKEITDSILYAERIQRSLLPGTEKIKSMIDDFFVLFKPRDIVSGDFYWTAETDHKSIIVAADCTGHGVPGAFMSMLGISFLNEIISENKILEASEILNRLRNQVIEALQQKGTPGEAKDGMDIALCVIDKQKGEIQFAGANNPVYYIRNDELFEIKGDKMPVAIHVKMDPFTNHVISYQNGDVFYLFSDGYADQFGGPLGKKFKYRSLKELLISIHGKKMEEQKTILDNRFEEWKGENDQVDDVVIIGFRV